MTFKSDWEKNRKLTIDAVEKTVRGVAIDLFAAIITATPVGNPSIWKTPYKPPNYLGGRLRGNWQASIGSPASGQLDTRDASGGVTVSKAAAVVNSFKADGSLYLTNNLPYAERIENGHSTQAPAGMVAVNVARFQAVVDKMARKNQK